MVRRLEDADLRTLAWNIIRRYNNTNTELISLAIQTMNLYDNGDPASLI